MTTKLSKQKPGRPRLHAELQKRRFITLSDSLTDKARNIGDGNISAGIRKALASHKQQ